MSSPAFPPLVPPSPAFGNGAPPVGPGSILGDLPRWDWKDLPPADDRPRSWCLSVLPSSPLPGCFPVEVAWSDPERCEHHQFRPEPEWATSGSVSESMPGEPWAELLSGCASAASTASRAADVLGRPSALVYSAQPARDRELLAMLLASLDAGSEGVPSIPVYDLDDLYAEACLPLLGLEPSPHGWACTPEERQRRLQPVRDVARDIAARAQAFEAWLPRVRRRPDLLVDAGRPVRVLRLVEAEVARRLAPERQG